MTEFKRAELVAAYVRVSTAEQKLHGLSLAAQKSKIQQYADDNNMHIVEWYVDEGVSGRKLIRKRPELQRMIQDAEKGKFTRILFIKIDRFFRSVAEYHEAMKRIAPVLWTATEEPYDLSTANGRMLVNMKLTIAELEADQTGERIRLVNDYKVQTGQPLVGTQSLPYGFMVTTDEKTGRKKIIRNPDEEEIVRDILDFYLIHQSKKRVVVYAQAKHHTYLSYNTVTNLLNSTMLYGAYRDNPAYCEPYIDKATFDKLQDILKRNIKVNTVENRAYYFSGLILCPVCGKPLKGTRHGQKHNGKKYFYKKYRCGRYRLNNTCTYNTFVSENVIEKMLLANIEKYLNNVKLESFEVTDNADAVTVPQQNIEDLYIELDRLNYSWRTGKIRTVEKYEKDYAALMEQIEELQATTEKPVVKDFSRIEGILHAGWREIYNNLDDAHKRAFWRSFIQSIEINWTKDIKEITRVNFF